MYTLLFVAFFNWELVKKADAEQEEHDNTTEEIMKKHLKEREQARELKKSLSKKDAIELFRKKFGGNIEQFMDQMDSEEEFEKAEETAE